MPRRPPSAALCVAFLALVVSLGGVSYAAVKLPKNSVGALQLKANAVLGTKIKAGAVTGPKVGANAVTGAKVAPDTLTGADVNERTLALPGATTRHLVSGPDFKGRTSAIPWTTNGSGTVWTTGGFDFLQAAAEVPQGAVITKVTYYLAENSAAGDPILALVRYRPSAPGGILEMRVAAPATDSLSRQAIDVTPVLSPASIVDTSTYRYQFLWRSGDNTAQSALAGAEIEWSFDPALIAAAASAPPLRPGRAHVTR